MLAGMHLIRITISQLETIKYFNMPVGWYWVRIDWLYALNQKTDWRLWKQNLTSIWSIIESACVVYKLFRT